MRKERSIKRHLTAILSLVVILTIYGGGVFAKQEGQPQKVCPILGGEIDMSAYVDYEGERVYFCCPGCKATFLKNPDQYIKDMQSKGIVLEKVPQARVGDKPGHTGDRGADHSSMGHGDDHPHGGSMH